MKSSVENENVPETGGTFHVQVLHTAEVAADKADLRVTVSGTSFVTGTQAFEKAREVASLVQALDAVGVPQSEIHLEGVTANTSAGALLKTSQASYRLRIRCIDLDRLGDILGAITAQKHVDLQELQWGYPDGETMQEDWLHLCIARANRKAALIAKGLGVRLLGVQDFSEHFSGPEESGAHTLSDTRMMRSRASEPPRVTSKELGLDIAHVKKVEMLVRVVYRISGFESEKTS
jgi:uncharacterized protein YggE